MNKLSIKFIFESKNVEVDDKLLENILEFGIRSLYGLIGGSLIHYEILELNSASNEILLECDDDDISKISSAVALIGSYGISRIQARVVKIT